MIEQAKVDCEHQWNWDKESRFCLKCRQVRTFPLNGNSGMVIWQGKDDKRNPIELTAEEKFILAHFAQQLGVKKFAGCIKIPMVFLRAWVGAYCGDHTKKYKPKQSISQKSQKRTKVSESDLPPFPTFNDNWEAPVQLEWLATYLELAKLKPNLPIPAIVEGEKNHA